jgi:CelD/BcsL family acetyltransferase involved in cellulose biosynthesis
VSTANVSLEVQPGTAATGVAGLSMEKVAVEPGLYHAQVRIRERCDLILLQVLLGALAENATGLTLFQSSEWITAAADAVIAGHRGDEVRVLVGFEDDRPVAALPLSISGPALCRVAKSLGDPLVQYSDILLCEQSRGLAALCAGLQAASDVDAFLFRRVRDDAYILPMLKTLGAQLITRSKAPFADLVRYGDFQRFLNSQPKKTRERARLRRRAQQDGTLTFEIAETASRAVDLAKCAIEFKRRWLRAQCIPSITLNSDTWCDALLRIVSSFSSAVRPIVTAIHLDHQPGAIEIGFVKGTTYYAFLGAFEPRFRRWSPSKLAMEETLRWCFASGITVYDLLAPDDAYKAEWTNDAVGVADWLFARTARGEIGVKFAERCARPAAKRIYSPIMRALRVLEGWEASNK